MDESKHIESLADSPPKIQDLIRLANEEKIFLQNQAQKIGLKIEAMDQVLLLLEGPAYSEDSSLLTQTDSPKKRKKQEFKINEELYPNYPSSKPSSEKILYVMDKMNVAMLANEIESTILQIEGPILGKRTVKFVKPEIKKLVSKGEIRSGKVANSNRYMFYILPRFLDQFNKLKNEHYPPKPESFGGLDDEKKSTIADCF